MEHEINTELHAYGNNSICIVDTTTHVQHVSKYFCTWVPKDNPIEEMCIKKGVGRTNT